MQFFASHRISAGLVMTLLVMAGCQAPQPVQGKTSAVTTPPTVGSPMQGVETEAKVLELEQWYNAEKNSRPTHQAEAEAKAAKKAKEQQLEAEKAAENKGP